MRRGRTAPTFARISKLRGDEGLRGTDLVGVRHGEPSPALTSTTGGRPPRARVLRDRRHHAPQPGADASHGVPGHGSLGNRRPATAPPHVPRPPRPAPPAVAGKHDGLPELRRPVRTATTHPQHRAAAGRSAPATGNPGHPRQIASRVPPTQAAPRTGPPTGTCGYLRPGLGTSRGRGQSRERPRPRCLCR